MSQPTATYRPERDDLPLQAAQPAARESRCRAGHELSSESILKRQSRALEQALWVTFHALQQCAPLLRNLAEEARERGVWGTANDYDERSREINQYASSICRVLAEQGVLSEKALAEKPGLRDIEQTLIVRHEGTLAAE